LLREATRLYHHSYNADSASARKCAHLVSAVAQHVKSLEKLGRNEEAQRILSDTRGLRRRHFQACNNNPEFSVFIHGRVAPHLVSLCLQRSPIPQSLLKYASPDAHMVFAFLLFFNIESLGILVTNLSPWARCAEAREMPPGDPKLPETSCVLTSSFLYPRTLP